MAFDSVSIADNTTIVGGSASAANRKDLLRDRIDEYDSASTYPKKGVRLHDFSKNTDYALGERPFFVPISPKDGVVAAMKKIDTQLRSVSAEIYASFRCLTFSVRTEWSPIPQGEPLNSMSRNVCLQCNRSPCHGSVGKSLRVPLV